MSPPAHKANPQDTLLPPGDYRAVFVRCEKGRVFNRSVWFAVFQITEYGPGPS